MLNIIDINSSSTNLNEIEFLKNEIQNNLYQTVTEGTVVIINDFPAIGNMPGKLDYIILCNIKKRSRNYLRTKINGLYKYFDSFIFLIKKISEQDITDADNNFLYSGESLFDYQESLNTIKCEFEDYCKRYQKIKCFSIYQISTPGEFCYSNHKILINKQLDAQYMLMSIANQYKEKYGDYRIKSFPKDPKDNSEFDFVVDFAKNIVRDAAETSKHGIITKRKLDRITTPTKLVEDISNNIGKSLSIVTGKAGTGKTLLLTRIIHKHASNGGNVRFLTYNHLLVFDIKQLLRGYGYYGDNRISIGTVHQFFFKLSSKLGISLIFGLDRVNELLSVCEERIEKVRPIFDRIKNDLSVLTNKDNILSTILKTDNNKADYDEHREFSAFLSKVCDLSSFDRIKTDYIKYKREIISKSIGRVVYLENYYKVLEYIFLAITDSKKFYEDLDIKNRYDLLAKLYKIDNIENIDSIPYKNLEKQVLLLRRTSNWSRLLVIDECQDNHFYEKEILFKLRGSENIIVASGGKEQLIRHPQVLDWSVSLNKRLPAVPFPLYGGSYRQKQNIISFINMFSDLYGIKVDLKSIAESKGLGKIIIDLRKKKTIIREDILFELLANGEINECSVYESLLMLIPSKNYTEKKIDEGFLIDENDYIQRVWVSHDRNIINLETLSKQNIKIWNGVVDDKSKLKVPDHDEARIIHYESCRGIEAWSCVCLSFDVFFSCKRATQEAGGYLLGDLFYSEEERRDKYAAVWCLMALTRPIDTLYIHLENTNSDFSKNIISLGKNCNGLVILNDDK